MNLRDLRYLVALAEHRHFGRAAEACFVSQPTLSTQIRKLEDELGVTLVERAPRKVLLTDVGREIAARARDVLNEAEQIRAIARRTRDPESGTVRLGIFPTLGPYLLPHVVPMVRETFPRLELLLVEEKTEVVLQRLREGKLDAGILALPLHEDSLHVEFLFEEPFLLAVPDSHPLAERKRLRLDDLADESLLLLEDGHCLRDQALEVCQLAGAGERSGLPRHQPGNAAPDGGRRRRHHPAADPGGQPAGGARGPRAPDRVRRRTRRTGAWPWSGARVRPCTASCCAWPMSCASCPRPCWTPAPRWRGSVPTRRRRPAARPPEASARGTPPDRCFIGSIYRFHQDNQFSMHAPRGLS